jgi:nucleoid-associated protein YgaU
MDYEYDGDEPYESRILWGRVGVYAASLLLMFLLGSCVGGRGEASEAEVAALREEVAELTEQNILLEEQIAALGSGAAAADDRPRISETDEEDPAAEGEDEAADGEAGAGETRTYEVQSGDTLTSIAQRMYGDSTKFGLIADANDLDGQLVVGQELIIPPAE